MNINKLFQIADAAKHIQAYDIANTVFAAIAQHAINNQAFGSCIEPDAEAQKINFQIEMEGDDLIESLSDPNGAGYYDLPRLTKWGDKLMGTNGALESHVLCIPLPLVSRYFCNMLVRLMDKETHNMGGGMLERTTHERKYWRLGHDTEKVEACRRDLHRRLLGEVNQDEIDYACRLILAKAEPEYEEFRPEPAEEVWLGPATLAKLKASVEDFEALETEEYYEEI